MVKFIDVLLCLALSLAVTFPAEAAFCRQSSDRLICIVSIKRSAKNYWEYRASVSVDGIKRPIEVYNCRDRIRIRKDGAVVPFESDGAGELICHFFQK
jgi:hypothetical protein